MAELLRTARTIAVVGLSDKKARPSHGVAQYMQSAGYRIIPVNPEVTEVLGEKAYPNLESVPEPVDIVDIFRRSEFVPPIVEAAIRIGAKADLDAGRRDPRTGRGASPGRGADRGDGPLPAEGAHAAGAVGLRPRLPEV